MESSCLRETLSFLRSLSLRKQGAGIQERFVHVTHTQVDTEAGTFGTKDHLYLISYPVFQRITRLSPVSN